MVVHFVLENSLEYNDSSEDEYSNAEEDQAAGSSLKHLNVPHKQLRQITFVLTEIKAFLLPLMQCMFRSIRCHFRHML